MSFFLQIQFRLILILVGVSFFSACTERPKLETYTKTKALNYPDSLKAKMTITVTDGPEKRNMTGILFAVPYAKYRMEMRGPLGMNLGSLLWVDDQWTLVVTRNGVGYEGEGDYLDVVNPAIPQIPFHRTLGVSWGDLLPKGWNNAQKDKQSDTLSIWRWNSGETGFPVEAEVNPKMGYVNLFRSGMYEVRYSDYKRFDGIVLPQKVEWFRNSIFMMALELESIDTKASWKPKIWELEIPEGFRRY